MTLFTPKGGTIFWLCTTFCLTLYLSLGFTVPKYIRFIRCIFLRNKVEHHLHPFAQIRQPIICTIYLSLFIFALYIIYPLVLILEILDGSNPLNMRIVFTCNMIIFFSFVSRVFAFALNQHICDTLNNWIWRKEINAKERETNMIIKYDRILDLNRSTVLILVYLFFTIPIFTLCMISSYLYYDHFPVIYTIIVVILLLSSYYIVTMKMCIVSDEYEVRSELLYTVRSSGLFYGLSCVLSIVLPHSYSILSQILCASIGHLCAIYFCCSWTVKRFALHNSLRGNVSESVTICDFIRAFADNKPIPFKHVMDHRVGIEAFCAQLVEEYSLDSILFLIEVSQFKAIIHKLRGSPSTENLLCNDTTAESTQSTRSLPTSQSNIFSVDTVLQNDWLPIDPRMTSHGPYKIALYLYDKYIDNAADFCINISCSDRRDIYKTFKELARMLTMEPMDNDETQFDESVLKIFYTVFDKSTSEIWHLLKMDSFFRFQSSRAMYRLLCALYPKQSDTILQQSGSSKDDSKTAKDVKTNGNLKGNETDGPHTDTSTIRSAQSVHSTASTLRSMPSLPKDIIGEEHITIDIIAEEEKYCVLPTDITTYVARSRAHSEDMQLKNNTPDSMRSISKLDGLRSKSVQQSLRSTTMEQLSQLLNTVTVPSDIIKTGADFWSDHINKLSQKDRLEVGSAIYFTMIASDRSIHQLFKRDRRIKQAQIEMLSVKFLDMICWLIESLWSRDLNTLNKQLSKLGAVHKQLQIAHFNVMIVAIHEVFQFYFAQNYRLQEQYAMDYIWAYSCEGMMGESSSRKGTNSNEYFKELELKHAAEKFKNSQITYVE